MGDFDTAAPRMAGELREPLTGAKSAKQPNHIKISAAQRKLFIGTGLCFLFMLTEVIGGAMAHSLAIMTDAAHMLSDVAGFFVSIL